MSRYISEALGREVMLRAGGVCEYCHVSIDDTYFGGEIDHIRSLKHGGATESPNLALACQPCNRNKGTDLGSFTIGSDDLVRFFNPRVDVWSDHFWVNENAEVMPLTKIGEVTTAIFRFNDQERMIERQGLIEMGRFIS